MAAHERLTELMRVEPPADLDVLVQHRARAVLESRSPRSEVSQATTAEPVRSSPPAVPLPWAERWVYAVGLAAYGGQAVLSAARLFWRAVAG